MNLSPRLADMLRHKGWSAEHWSDIGDPRASDSTILQWAREHECVVVTHDLDFGAILAATGADSPSVVQFRRQNVLPEALVEPLSTILSQHAAVLERGALITVDAQALRLRVLPLRRS
jgi:predicted nuclease of predicted toxin-antitoxin system